MSTYNTPASYVKPGSFDRTTEVVQIRRIDNRVMPSVNETLKADQTVTVTYTANVGEASIVLKSNELNLDPKVNDGQLSKVRKLATLGKILYAVAKSGVKEIYGKEQNVVAYTGLTTEQHDLARAITREFNGTATEYAKATQGSSTVVGSTVEKGEVTSSGVRITPATLDVVVDKNTPKKK